MINKIDNHIIDKNSKILITGSNGFIGSNVVRNLIARGFSNLRCLVRRTSNLKEINEIKANNPSFNIELFKGDLLVKKDCNKMVKDVSVIYHVAAGMSGSYSSKFLNSVVTTRNLIESSIETNSLKRFVNVSSFSVYSNFKLRRKSILDETCNTVEKEYNKIYNSYAFAKNEQDRLILEYREKFNYPSVIMRPGTVYGPGVREKITTHIGNKTFGVLLQIGAGNILPLTYIDNCAEAIVLAGLVKNIDGEIINIIDDEKISNRKFLKLYKKYVFNFRSIYVPYYLFYWFSIIFEKFAKKSHYYIPPNINKRKTAFFWKGNIYPNHKLKKLLSWKQKVSFEDGSKLYFRYMKNKIKNKKIC